MTEVSEIGFKMNFMSDYHRVGAFLNAIETGQILVRVKKIDLTLRSVSGFTLQTDLEGVAYILPQKYLQ